MGRRRPTDRNAQRQTQRNLTIFSSRSIDYLMNNDQSNGAAATILMAGPTRVGKTSLLASMYRELKREMLDIKCSFHPEAGPSSQLIQRALAELEDVAHERVMIQEGKGIASTEGKREFKFELQLESGPPIPFRFIDLPGAWYTNDGNNDELVEAKKCMRAADVTFLAVDTPALMETPSEASQILDASRNYHRRINNPDAIFTAFGREILNLKDGHIVILTLIRAEKYVLSPHTGNLEPGESKKILNRATEAYRELATILDSRKIPLYACWVNTIGNVRFSRFDIVDGNVQGKYERIKNKAFHPEHCAVPLRLGISKSIDTHRYDQFKKMTKLNTWPQRIKGWFTDETPLKRQKRYVARVNEVLGDLINRLESDDFVKVPPQNKS